MWGGGEMQRDITNSYSISQLVLTAADKQPAIPINPHKNYFGLFFFFLLRYKKKWKKNTGREGGEDRNGRESKQKGEEEEGLMTIFLI